MSEQQWKRWDVVTRLTNGSLTTDQAAQVLGLSSRQLRRLCLKVEKEGKAGLRHGNQGRRAWNRHSDEKRRQVTELFQAKYAGFNDQHFTEQLNKVEKIAISRSRVQSVLRRAGLAAARKRRPPKHRKRRDRKAQAGLMILWDGSRHDWLEGRGPMLCLMGAIDDATSDLLPGAHFVEQECAAGYLVVLRAIILGKGIPHSAYMDRHGSLCRNDDYWTLAEELRGEQDPTQVGKAIKALEIEAIFALSPQAKGRVERLWNTAQDRLCSEMRLANACTLEEANAVLERYRPEHNLLFAVPAADITPAWRSVRAGVDVDRICSFRYETDVRNDNTARIAGHVIDIPPGPGGRSYAKVHVEVCQLLDGSWRVYAKDQIIARAAATNVGELRALPQRKRSAASRAFRKGIERVATSLP